MGSSGAIQDEIFVRTSCILWADNTGRFARIGKPSWFKLFMEAKDNVIEALCTLCDEADISVNLGPVCLYCIPPKGLPALKYSRVALAPVLTRLHSDTGFPCVEEPSGP